MTHLLPLGCLGLLVGCAADVPAACDRMCDAATAVYGACLEPAGGWAAGGYDDAADFTGSCETWAWEMRRLEADAVERGALDAAGALAAACRVRAEALSDDGATCDTFTDVEWHTPPWEAE